LNALPGYSSSRAREARYLSLDRSGNRTSFESVVNSNAPASYGYIGTSHDGFDARPFVNTPSFAIPKTLSASPLSPLTTIKQFDGVGGSWSVSTNWAPDGVPTGSDDVLFDNTFRDP